MNETLTMPSRSPTKIRCSDLLHEVGLPSTRVSSLLNRPTLRSKPSLPLVEEVQAMSAALVETLLTVSELRR